jgi:chaperone modulatory protein CbpM
MSPEELIPAREFCTFHHVELSFIHSMHDSGLIGMTIRDGAVFLPADELPKLERLVRWHYELSINPEGIEALSHVLQRLEYLLQENSTLRGRLRHYENDNSRFSAGPADFSEL